VLKMQRERWAERRGVVDRESGDLDRRRRRQLMDEDARDNGKQNPIGALLSV
jgi:hypothetical protein